MLLGMSVSMKGGGQASPTGHVPGVQGEMPRQANKEGYGC